MANNEHSAPRRIPASLSFWIFALGFGAYLSWGMIGASPSMMSPDIAQAVGLTAIDGIAERLCWLAAIAITGIVAWRARSYHRSAAAIITALATAIGTATVHILVLQGSTDAFILSAAQFPTVISSIFIVLWGERLCSLDGKEAFQYVVIASTFSFFSVLLCMVVPTLLQTAIQVLLPLASGVAFVYTQDKTPLPAPTHVEQDTPFPVRAFVGIGLFGVVIVLLQLFSEGKTDQPNELLWIVAGLCVNVAFLGVSLTYKGEIKASTLSRLILPLMALSTFFVFATDFEQRAIEVFAVGCSWIYFRLFTWVVWRIGALKSPLHPACAIAFGQIVLTLGTVVGSALYRIMGTTGMPPLGALAVIVTISILIATFFLDTHYIAELADPHTPFDPTNPALCERCADLATERFGLSGQERTIALMLVRGDSNDSIRDELVIAQSTLRTHLRNMYRKTETHSREDLVLLLRSLYQ